MPNFFSFHTDLSWVDLGGGISRSIVGTTPQLMAALVKFEKGAVGAAHTHDIHHQTSYVLKGSFEATIGGAAHIIRAGDAYIVPPNTLHGVVALEADSILLDHFTPQRDDYL